MFTNVACSTVCWLKFENDCIKLAVIVGCTLKHKQGF